MADFLRHIPETFETEGRLLYDGRNQIRCLDADGVPLVVKRYKRHDWLKRVVYTWFRSSKARRAFDNAHELRRRGFCTPEEVACIEVRTCGTVSQVYYVCRYTEAQPIRPQLIDRESFDRELARAYARYVATLHEHGVLHRDLNPTNVLYTVDTEARYRFELIDINRMRFYDGPVPKPECMENLTLFWWLTDVYRFVLQTYATQRGWTEADVADAIRQKQRHDRHWVRRKRLTHPLRALRRSKTES